MLTPKLPCPKCHSSHTELRNTAPDNLFSHRAGLFNEMVNMFRETASGFGRLVGQKYLVCKDCGHVSLLQVL